MDDKNRDYPSDVQTPAQEPLPDVFASLAGETVYLIRCGVRNVLVDAGYLHNVEAHLGNFEALGLDLASVDAILVTHFHVDHAAGLARARARLDCPVVAHRNTAPVIEAGNRTITAALMPYLGWDFPFPACKVDAIVDHGDTIQIGTKTFTVIHLPGHTPGCTGYLWGGNLITGDVLFPGGGIGWSSPNWGTNFYDYVDTMDRIADLSPAHLLPTHGLPFAFDPADCVAAQTYMNGQIEAEHAGILIHTPRASLRDPNETPRTLCF